MVIKGMWSKCTFPPGGHAERTYPGAASLHFPVTDPKPGAWSQGTGVIAFVISGQIGVYADFMQNRRNSCIKHQKTCINGV